MSRNKISLCLNIAIVGKQLAAAQAKFFDDFASKKDLEAICLTKASCRLRCNSSMKFSSLISVLPTSLT